MIRFLEAEIFIDRLVRRYLNGNGHAQPGLPEQSRRSTARLQDDRSEL
jgi:hypothetical protein